MGYIIKGDHNDKLVTLDDDGDFIFIVVGDDAIAQIDKELGTFELVESCSKENTGFEIDEQGCIVVYKCGEPLNGPNFKPAKAKK